MIVYHIIPRSEWEKAVNTGIYTPPSIAQEGFIHASTREQVADTANRYYHGQPGLILLVIDTERSKPEVRFDVVQLRGAETRFPHIYGPLNLDAVIDQLPFEPDSAGEFHFPTT